jgi:hypothetical protein
MTLLAFLAPHPANLPLTVALYFGLAGAFYLGIYLLHRIRARNAILKRHLRAEAYRPPDSKDADRPALKPYKTKLAPIDLKALPRRFKHPAPKRRLPKPYKCKIPPVNLKGLPPPRVEARICPVVET